MTRNYFEWMVLGEKSEIRFNSDSKQKKNFFITCESSSAVASYSTY